MDGENLLGLYRHFRGKLYCVYDVCMDATNGRGYDRLICYIDVQTGEKYARTEKEFFGTVNGQKRFERIDKI